MFQAISAGLSKLAGKNELVKAEEEEEGKKKKKEERKCIVSVVSSWQHHIEETQQNDYNKKEGSQYTVRYLDRILNFQYEL